MNPNDLTRDEAIRAVAALLGIDEDEMLVHLGEDDQEAYNFTATGWNQVKEEVEELVNGGHK